MRFLKIIIILAVPLSVLSQQIDFSKTEKLKLNDFKPGKQTLLKSDLDVSDSLKTVRSESKIKGSKKSPGLAFIYGLLIPGMGHVYSNRFSSGKYFMITEAVTWLTYAAFTIYGNWLLDDAYDYASVHAGARVTDKAKDDKFFINIANYRNVEEYNDEMLRFGNYDQVYYPGDGKDFYWNSDSERLKYRQDKISADRTLTDRLFVVGAILINHVISGISAVFAANSYNDELKQKGSGGFSLSAGVLRSFNKVDGIRINLTKNF